MTRHESFESAEGTTDTALVRAIDEQLAHVWMVRTFLKHSDEAEEDDELRDVHRALYDFMLALGKPLQDDDHARYLKLARKKLKKLRVANELFQEIQPEVSSHTNFVMAASSLRLACARIETLLSC